MDNPRHVPSDFPRSTLPWLVAAAALALYLITLNRWTSLSSLPYVARVAGWDWTLPQQAPLFYLLTFPIRWLPASIQPLALNAFSAVCAGLALALLARSVGLLPHDRTHEQRQKERSDRSLLSIPTAWLPPVFAAAVLAVQLTFWENAVAATNEALDLLLFAYLIRCLLEYRLERRESWLVRFTFVYGLATANNWAMLGFLPLFLGAVIWILGRDFLRPRLLLKMTLGGAAGLMLYLLLPLAAVWTGSGAGFWETLRTEIGMQKIPLFHIPGLRNRAVVLSLTSILPVLIIGIRWPSSFGDTSAAGTQMTNLMFRVIHVALLAACLWIMFDQQFSPRALGMGIPFLTFYYLSALGIGYFSGYLLLIFEGGRSRSRHHRRSSVDKALGPLFKGAVWLALLVVPVALIYKNFGIVRAYDGRLLRQFAAQLAERLPEEGATVLSDDVRPLLLLQGYMIGKNEADRFLFLVSKALPRPEYQRHLAKAYPGVWTDLSNPDEPEAEVSAAVILRALEAMARAENARPLYYAHPSFGYYFERFYQSPRGPVSRLGLYEPGQVFPPTPSEEEITENEAYWGRASEFLSRIDTLPEADRLESQFLSAYYSRGLNEWGVRLRRQGRLEEAAPRLKLAVELNTNNIPARINLAYNEAARSETNSFDASLEDIEFRSWDDILARSGSFDTPTLCLRLGERLGLQRLYRQAAAELQRATELAPANLEPWISLANIYLLAQLPDRVLEVVSEVRADPRLKPLPPARALELIRLEAGALFAQKEFQQAEELILTARKQFPRDVGLFDTLLEIYAASERWTDALAAVEARMAETGGDLDLRLTQASLLLKLDQGDRALEAIDAVLTQEPRNARALLFKGIVYLEQDRFSEAIDQFDAVLSAEADNVDALLSKSAALLESENYERALEPLNRALEEQPRNWAALRNRAICNFRLNRLKAARGDYESLLEVLPGYHPAYFGLGEIAYREKQTDDAIRYYNLYLKNAPSVETPELVKERQQVEERVAELRRAQN